jgi:hypothetical protein
MRAALRRSGPAARACARFRLDKRRFAGASSRDGLAPIPVVRGATIGRLKSTQSCPFGSRWWIVVGAIRTFDLDWTQRMKNSPSVIVTASGKRGCLEAFGITVPEHGVHPA